MGCLHCLERLVFFSVELLSKTRPHIVGKSGLRTKFYYTGLRKASKLAVARLVLESNSTEKKTNLSKQ
jgi:hypothetical protein